MEHSKNRMLRTVLFSETPHTYPGCAKFATQVEVRLVDLVGWPERHEQRTLKAKRARDDH